MAVIKQTHVPGVEPLFRGKVRDIYDLGERLLLVATDRISAYDVVLPTVIPEKGAILTSITRFWLKHLNVRDHLVSTTAEELPEPFVEPARSWGPRFMVVEKLRMIPLECVVRGYIAGSGWKEYHNSGTVCGIGLPAGLKECAELDHPLFTPSTKAADGHDENITKKQAEGSLGEELVSELERRSVALYERARLYAMERGVILADTKFEFGQPQGESTPVLADEVLTPDSSRYWPADQYQPGKPQLSYDKQYVRDFLQSVGWRGDGAPPALPQEVVQGTVERYREIYRRLTGQEWNGTDPS
ncbi:MAG: phosphoribosylaminoimidazolesuccinocarboxamide synthase [Planctomycetota bacterium]